MSVKPDNVYYPSFIQKIHRVSLPNDAQKLGEWKACDHSDYNFGNEVQVF